MRNDCSGERSSGTEVGANGSAWLTSSDRTPQVNVSLAPEGHMLLVLPPGEVVTGTMAATAAAEVDRLAGTRKMPMLLVLSGVEALTRGARTVFGSEECLGAVAVLGVSPVDRVIANFLLGGATQPCPTRYFSSEQEALAWLKRKIIA